MILNEGSRDNLLIPIINIYKEKTGKDVSVSAMKQYILAKLVNEANIRNLSLDSNYYLAGAAHYYVNGDLTTNKVLNIFDESQTDVFNREICQRLNALILILRNSYIDSIGTQWEQPEDFGKLPINKLLRKYGAAINKALGIATPKKDKPKEEVIDYNIGNDYTFDILYSYEDATKYNSYTEPGAWCITYGQQHFRNYTSWYGGCHFVIFLKNGYQDVPRKKEPELWKGDKPQDTYGNSMIALLQNNRTGEPVLITSRWNHGSSIDNSHCEADHAYTKEEFFQIVGINDADLQKIQKIWEKQRNTNRGSNEARRALNAHRLEALRYLKYCQIKMNGGNRNPFGDNWEETLVLSNIKRYNETYLKYKDTARKMMTDNPNLSQEEKDVLDNKWKVERGKLLSGSVWAAKVKVEGIAYYFLVDGNKILFETLVEEGEYDKLERHFSSSQDYNNEYYYYKAYGLNNVVVCNVINGIMLYDIRLHKFIEVEGIKKFKFVAELTRWDIEGTNNVFYEVAMSLSQIALINNRNNKALVLPNGHSWCESISSSSCSWRHGSNMKCYSANKGSIVKLMYDSASGESYLFDLSGEKFLDINKKYRDFSLDKIDGSDVISVRTYRKSETPDENGIIHELMFYLLFKNGQQIAIDGYNEFKDVDGISNGNIFIKTPYNQYIIYNGNSGKHIYFPSLPTETSYITFDNNYKYNGGRTYDILEFCVHDRVAPYGQPSYSRPEYFRLYFDNVNFKFIKAPWGLGMFAKYTKLCEGCYKIQMAQSLIELANDQGAVYYYNLNNGGSLGQHPSPEFTETITQNNLLETKLREVVELRIRESITKNKKQILL